MTAQSAAGRVNLHATVFIAGSEGVMVLGPSGEGKSSLALAVIEHFCLRGRFAALVADDGVWLSVSGGRLVAEAPQAIAGLVEVRGFGPAACDHEPRAVIDRVVRLVPRAVAPRMAEDGTTETVLDISLPAISLAEGYSTMTARAVAAWLDEAFAHKCGNLARKRAFLGLSTTQSLTR